MNRPLFLITLLAIVLTAGTSLTAQITWDGGGDGTSWQDAANWSIDMVPPADSSVEIRINAIITGTAPASIARIIIGDSVDVTLDLDLNIGNGSVDFHGLVLNSYSTVYLGKETARTITVNPIIGRQCIANFAAADSAILIVPATTTINLVQGLNGLNLANPTSSIHLAGVVNFAADVKNGIKSAGFFTNTGTLNMTGNGTDGIQVSGGVFTNAAAGTINIAGPGDDCIEILGGGNFVNQGKLSLVIKADAGTANNTIAAGAAADAGTFTNAAGGEVTADAGAGANSRAISVNEMGTLSNSGTITLAGGNAGARYYNRGISTNEVGGLLDLGNGRINLNMGSLTNNGLLKSTFEGSGILNAGTATNNAFFDYNGANQFSAGTTGVNENNGINLNDSTAVNIDAAGACTIDLAQAAYEWFAAGESIATAGADGALTFPAESLQNDSVVLTTTIAGVSITVRNICPEAVMISSLFAKPREVLQLSITPNVVRQYSDIRLELPDQLQFETITFDIVDLNGRLINSIVTTPGRYRTIAVEGLQSGLYLLRGRETSAQLIGKFIVTR